MKKMDKLVTGLIIWGAAASIFGLSRTKKGKKLTGKVMDAGKHTAKHWYAFFGKSLAEIVSFFFKKK